MCPCVNLFINCIAVADELKPSHVGLDYEAQQARKWKGSSNGKNGRNGSQPNQPPPIKYIHLHECDKFSVSILILSALCSLS